MTTKKRLHEGDLVRFIGLLGPVNPGDLGVVLRCRTERPALSRRKRGRGRIVYYLVLWTSGDKQGLSSAQHPGTLEFLSRPTT